MKKLAVFLIALAITPALLCLRAEVHKNLEVGDTYSFELPAGEFEGPAITAPDVLKYVSTTTDEKFDHLHFKAIAPGDANIVVPMKPTPDGRHGLCGSTVVINVHVKAKPGIWDQIFGKKPATK